MQAAKTVMQLRAAMCQTSAGSKGLQAFWAKEYSNIKAANPKLPVLLRECAGTPASMTATYEHGVEKKVAVEGMSETEVAAALQGLFKGP